MSLEDTYDSSRAAHPFDLSLLTARCVLCGVPAAHEVAECMRTAARPTDAYLCCTHFSWIVGDCARSPYGLPAQRQTDA